MIDPTNITKFDRTEPELEEFLLFCVLVAGKNSNVQAGKLERFLNERNTRGYKGYSPFEYINGLITDGHGDYTVLRAVMMGHGLGQYNRLTQCFLGIVLNLLDQLSVCTVADLEAISGIGPKTARFFLTHTRPNQQFAVLDTHMLRYLRDEGFHAPKTTPSGKMYAALEQVVLQCAKTEGMSPAEFDLMVWNKYSKNGNNHLDK